MNAASNTNQGPRFHCPHCDKAYTWQEKIAGRKVRCKCGQVFSVGQVASEDPVPLGPPPEPDPEEESGYELDLPDEPAATKAPPPPTSGEAPATPTATKPVAHNGKCPSCNLAVRPGAVICMNCGFNLAEGKKVQTVIATGPATDEPSDDKTGDKGPPKGDSTVSNTLARAKLQEDLQADMARKYRFQETMLPLILLGAGLLLMVFNCVVLAPRTPLMSDLSTGVAMLVYLILSVVMFVVQMPCLFIGVLAVSKIFGAAFGELFNALKKLAAIALLCGSVNIGLDLGFDILMDGFGGIAWMVKSSISFIVFWVVAQLMFDELEVGETIGLWCAMIFLPGLAMIILGGIILGLL